MGVHVDQRLAVAALHAEVRLGVNSVPPDSGAPSPLVPTDDRLLLAERGAVPGLDVHVDAPGDEVGAAGHPVGRRRRRPARPRRAAASLPGSSALRFAVPSLKPNRLRGVAWAVDVDDVRPKPSWDQRTAAVPNADAGQVADRVHGDLRVVGAGLDAQVAAAERRVEVVAGEVRQLDEAPRHASARARTGPCRPVSNSVGPKPKVRVRPDAGRPSASPVSSGGASYGPSAGP